MARSKRSWIMELDLLPTRVPSAIGKRRLATSLAILGCAGLIVSSGCSRAPSHPAGSASDVLIDPAGMLHPPTALSLTSGPPKAIRGPGLVGVVGGARLKLLNAGSHELLLAMPQLTEHQVPITYGISNRPAGAAQHFHLHQRDNANVVVRVTLSGKANTEIELAWAAVVLITERPSSIIASSPEPYLAATPCVQAEAGSVKGLAGKLWPAGGEVLPYLANIQQHIRAMKQRKPPRSMDALGILDSGGNWICTANANLAAALLRAKGIPARSVATVPPIHQRLEMHRIVEYADRGQWSAFDPSSLQADLPLQPWQNVVMARTTIADESSAMIPRMGSAIGCPYGQELEFLDSGITLWGQDFFWTQGVALAGFSPAEETVALAESAWRRFLATGRLGSGQIQAGSATNEASFVSALRAP